MTKTARQLDREIADALSRRSKRRPRRHHATVPATNEEPLRDVSDDAWDVAMDAILEHDPKKAAEIWHSLRKEYGFVTAPPSFLKALHAVPADVRWKFDEYVSAGTTTTGSTGSMGPTRKDTEYALPAFYELIRRPSDAQIWFKATEELKKPGYKGLQVVWYAGDRKPKKAKQSTIQRIDIDQGAYRQITADKLPAEVFTRFEERR